MVLYKTKRTGVINDITNPGILKRVRALPLEYEEVKPESKKVKAEPDKTG